MTNFQQNLLYTQKQHNLLRRKELIAKLRRKASWYQFFALIFMGGGLSLDIWMKITHFQDLMLTGIAIGGLLIGISFQISSVIYYSKAKKHLSGLTVNASTNPKDWV